MSGADPSTVLPTPSRLQVGVVGRGAIGGTVARLLEEGAIHGCALSGVLSRARSETDRAALIDRSALGGLDLVSAREAAAGFPESANVAATLALATTGLDITRVTVVGDPSATVVRHTVHASGDAGAYEISLENPPRPTTRARAPSHRTPSCERCRTCALASS